MIKPRRLRKAGYDEHMIEEKKKSKEFFF